MPQCCNSGKKLVFGTSSFDGWSGHPTRWNTTSKNLHGHPMWTSNTFSMSGFEKHISWTSNSRDIQGHPARTSSWDIQGHPAHGTSSGTSRDIQKLFLELQKYWKLGFLDFQCAKNRWHFTYSWLDSQTANPTQILSELASLFNKENSSCMTSPPLSSAHLRCRELRL